MRVIILATIAFFCVLKPIGAFQEPDWDKLANAIYKAEGGSKTAHPYGILAKYKHTTPRQACINTCKHAYRDWLLTQDREARPARLAPLGSPADDYLAFLAKCYAPIGVLNDPNGLNRNWLRNVKYFYSK